MNKFFFIIMNVDFSVHVRDLPILSNLLVYFLVTICFELSLIERPFKIKREKKVLDLVLDFAIIEGLKIQFQIKVFNATFCFALDSCFQMGCLLLFIFSCIVEAIRVKSSGKKIDIF